MLIKSEANVIIVTINIAIYCCLDTLTDVTKHGKERDGLAL